MTQPGDYLRAYETPRLARLGRNLYAACFPLMKLMPARFMLEQAWQTGRLGPKGHIVETTSGTFGLALALLAAVRGHRLTLVTASTLTDATYTRRLEELGAKLEIVEDRLANGDQDGRLARLQEILATEPDAYWPNQYANPDNRLAYAGLGRMLTREIGRIDCLVGPVGTGGSLFGTGEFLRNYFPDMRIVAVDTHNSVLFGQLAGKRMLRGLGNSILPANVLHEMVDDVHWVGALPAFLATRRLYLEHGAFMGPTSGAAALVGAWYARTSKATTVVIMPDEGYRYLDTVHNKAWLEGLAGWPLRKETRPRMLERILPDTDDQWTCFLWSRRRLTDISIAQATLTDPSPGKHG